MQQALGAGVQRGECRVVDEAGHDHALARDAFGREGVVKPSGELSEVTDDDEAQVLVAIGRGGEGPQEATHVLPRIELSDIEDVPAGHAEALPRDAPALVVVRRREGVIHGLGDHMHPFLRHAATAGAGQEEDGDTRRDPSDPPPRRRSPHR